MDNMSKTYRTPTLYCIGEALVDFIPAGEAPDGIRLLAPMPGGAPANTAIAAAKLGVSASFIGKVGEDGFGRLLIDVIDNYGVGTEYMSLTRTACTTLAFVTLSDEGDRSFTFARKPGADMMLSEDDIPDGLFSSGDILHFGSLGLMPDSLSKTAHKKAILAAKSAGALISFDPNIRLLLWDDVRVLKATILEYLPFADIIKVSDDELDLIFGTDDEKAAASYCFTNGASVLFVTRGKNGAAVYTPTYSSEAAGLPVTVLDTTGAGDAFNGAMLSRFVGMPVRECLIPEILTDTLRFANTAGSITVTRKGAMAGSPALDEILTFS